MTYVTIRYALADNVATITLARPDKLNALTPRVFEEMTAAIDEVLAVARRLAKGPTVAIGMIRKQVASSLNQTLSETLATESANQSRAERTEDFKESVTAFAEKRKPIFKGR